MDAWEGGWRELIRLGEPQVFTDEVVKEPAGISYVDYASMKYSSTRKIVL